MKLTYKLLVPALLAGLLLVSCGEKETAPVEEMATEAVAPAEEMATGDAAPAEEAVSQEPGGYVPTPDELIPGETRE